jgi:hypothetical protein
MLVIVCLEDDLSEETVLLKQHRQLYEAPTSSLILLHVSNAPKTETKPGIYGTVDNGTSKDRLMEPC